MKATGPFLLVSGRWDNVVSIVDIPTALQAANNGTANAIVTRVRVTPDIDAHDTGVMDTPASGQPVSLVIAADSRLAYVVNHSGRSTPAAASAFQHGHPGTITVLNMAKALDPTTDGTNAIEDIIATGTAGPVGIALTPDQRHLVVSSAEAHGHEDGGQHIALIDVQSRKVVRQVAQAVVHEDGKGTPQPSPHPGPHETFGRFPNANGVAVSVLDGGTIVTGNGGTDDVSIISLRRALEGDPRAEIARVPVQAGPFGVAVSRDGRLAAIANRENARTGIEGNTISLIDIGQAMAGSSSTAEIARIRVGTDTSNEATRPFAVTFTPDGAAVLATCFRSNTISRVDVGKAISGAPAEERRAHFAATDGGPGRPRGIVMLPDGKHAAVIGGAKGAAGSSLVWIIDAVSLHPLACVTGVGNESYLLDVLPGRPS